ncbi:MAG: sel1 repeat family protein [Bacteroidales bacterium]|nr:sel1 repeat family protein [Bacteroidales bacterium]
MNAEDYKLKANEGSAKAQCALGIFYYKGEQGFEKDFDKAFYWIKKAADQGYAFAIYRLGICYLEGKGVASDNEKALEYINIAAQKGDEDAAHFLRTIEKGHAAMVDTKEDPYRDAYKAKEREEKPRDRFSAGFWFREVKINAMLVLIAVVMTVIATIAFIVLFGDRWDPNVLDRRTTYMAVGSFVFSVFVLVVGRYFTKIIHRLYKNMRKRGR